MDLLVESKERSILDLDEIRELILVHLDTEERREAALACPNFYEIVCRLDKNKKLELTGKVSL